MGTAGHTVTELSRTENIGADVMTASIMAANIQQPNGNDIQTAEIRTDNLKTTPTTPTLAPARPTVSPSRSALRNPASPRRSKAVSFVEDVVAWPLVPKGRSICRFSVPKDAKNMARHPDLVEGIVRLVEWCPLPTTATQARARIEMVEDRLPSSANHPNRSEEARTVATMGIFEIQSPDCGVGIIHRPLEETIPHSLNPAPRLEPRSLRELIVTLPKPSCKDRRILSHVVATQARSLYVHFGLVHGALRADSFVFFPAGGGSGGADVDLRRPYVLDWARDPAAPGMYQHPGFREGTSMWAYDVWSVLMILSEIAEWKPLEEDVFDGLGGGGEEDPAALLMKKKARRDLVTSSSWKGIDTAALFRFGFAAIDHDWATVAERSQWDVKRFWDQLCEFFGVDL